MKIFKEDASDAIIKIKNSALEIGHQKFGIKRKQVKKITKNNSSFKDPELSRKAKEIHDLIEVCERTKEFLKNMQKIIRHFFRKVVFKEDWHYLREELIKHIKNIDAEFPQNKKETDNMKENFKILDSIMKEIHERTKIRPL